MSSMKEQTIEEAARLSRQESRDRREEVEALIRTPGWKHYIEWLKIQKDARIEQILEPSSSLDALILQHYRTGAAWAFGTAAQGPQILIDFDTSIIEDLSESEEQARLMAEAHAEAQRDNQLGDDINE